MAQLEEHITVFRTEGGQRVRVGGAFTLTAEQVEAAREAAGLAPLSSPTPEDAVAQAAQAVDGYEEMTSADLATAISQPGDMAPTDLTGIGQGAAAHGAVEGEFGEVFEAQYSGYLARFEKQIGAGHYTSAKLLIAEMPPSLKSSMSAATLEAIGQVLDGRMRRKVDVVADELGVTAPDPVTAADVDAALGRA